MTVLRRLADPRLRAAWYGAAAAIALAAVVMTGAIFWLVTPWWHLAAAAAAGGGYLWLWQRGTFAPHEGTRRRGGLTPDEREAVRDALDAAERHSQDRLRGVLPQGEETLVYAGHSPDWEPRGSEAGTPMAAARYEPRREPRTATVIIEDDPPQPVIFDDYDLAVIGLYEPEPVQALVYDDPPPGREYDAPLDVRHHAPPAGLTPYCSRCGRYGHWTGQQHCADAVVDELLARRRDGHVAAAIAGHLRDAGLKVYDCEDDAVDSIMMRALNGPPAIEGAKRNG